MRLYFVSLVSVVGLSLGFSCQSSNRLPSDRPFKPTQASPIVDLVSPKPSSVATPEIPSTPKPDVIPK